MTFLSLHENFCNDFMRASNNTDGLVVRKRGCTINLWDKSDESGPSTFMEGTPHRIL